MVNSWPSHSTIFGSLRIPGGGMENHGDLLSFSAFGGFSIIHLKYLNLNSFENKISF